MIRSLFAAVLSLIMMACSNKEEYTVSGQIENPGNIKVVSLYEGDRKLDSVYLNESHKFSFVRPSTQARLLSLEAGKKRYYIIAQPGEEVILKADLQKEPYEYEVSGSDLSAAIKEFAPVRIRRDVIQDSLQNEFAKRTDNLNAEQIESLRGEYMTKFKAALHYYNDQAIAFKNKHRDLAGFYAMSTLDPEVAEAEIIAYADEIKDDFKDNGYVEQFKQETAKLKVLAIGQPAPLFEAYTPQNKLVKLNDYKGKYTLVDFWASWCAPCRQENPNIVKQYHAFKDKGFDVLGVSLDNNPGPWMRAIADDKLEWTNISDLQAWGSEVVGLYRIKAIPTSYIVDPEGKIAAKNLRGKDLEEFLKKTLN
ncbi:TlpA family protein disulfide reductase [Sphingobacterium spiritivorum]|uniref:TlpA family protein disulfide reductase n=1 Tax=Sphingobacterium spiritivorum TaxID=258 RepID=UPI003DA377D2